MRKDAYRIATPSAALTVRGTEFDLAVGEDGVTYLHVLGGAVLVTGANGETREVGAGQSVNISAAGVPGAPALAAAVPQGALVSKIGQMDAVLADALPSSPSAPLSSVSVLSQARTLRAGMGAAPGGLGSPGGQRDHSGKDKKGGKL